MTQDFLKCRATQEQAEELRFYSASVDRVCAVVNRRCNWTRSCGVENRGSALRRIDTGDK